MRVQRRRNSADCDVDVSRTGVEPGAGESRGGDYRASRSARFCTAAAAASCCRCPLTTMLFVLFRWTRSSRASWCADLPRFGARARRAHESFGAFTDHGLSCFVFFLRVFPFFFVLDPRLCDLRTVFLPLNCRSFRSCTRTLTEGRGAFKFFFLSTFLPF
ncbi:hypothetical protein BJV78DRAFT_1189808 [Lactifluus subvellereus]|nr:hypothetical protein BJV78DRAFT_1189808 [Lactifluus subvellereus]